MKIALDIDGVIADTSAVMKLKVAKHFDMDKRLLKAAHDYNNIYKLKDQELHDEVNDYVRYLFQTDPEVYLQAEEVEGAWFGSRIIKPIAYITRRPEGYGIGPATEEWLKVHNFPVAPVHYIPRGTCKSVKAKELGVDILVEDSPHELVSCRENGLKTIAMKYPYNVSILDKEDLVVHNWKELIEWFEGEI